MAENKPVGDSPRSKQESAAKDWHDLALGTWFFHDSPGSLERYSVQERTDGGCSIVCSTPYHYPRAKQNMEEIAKRHNELGDTSPRTQPFKYYPKPWEFREEGYNGGPRPFHSPHKLFPPPSFVSPPLQ